MVVKELIDVYEILDSSMVSGEMVKKYLLTTNPNADVEVVTLNGDGGKTDFLKVFIPGREGQSSGGSAKTLGIVGRLGGIGARPLKKGFVSDGDGALAVIIAASKLLKMQRNGDALRGDIIISTHICGNAPILEHSPVSFMGAPVSMDVMNKMEVDNRMNAILSVDTTKGNRINNKNGIAITPTVKEGYILRTSEDLLDIMEITTGKHANVLAITQQDITPYGNGLYHINSILQPATATIAPVVGVAISSESIVAGSATGASHFVDIEETSRFVIEVAKSFGDGKCEFFDKKEFNILQKKYGDMSIYQTKGR